MLRWRRALERDSKSRLRVQLVQTPLQPKPQARSDKTPGEEVLGEYALALTAADSLLGYDKWFKLDKKKGKGELHLVIRFYPAARLEDKYELGEKLGHGAQSTVKKLRHPNIVELYDVFHSRAAISLVMEHASGGELFEELSQRGRLCEQDAQYVFRQIAQAVNYLHSRGVAHRDLKARAHAEPTHPPLSSDALPCGLAQPENILVTKGEEPRIKLADFGVSVETEAHDLKTLCGSPSYVAPEVLECRPYTLQCDCWSLGVVLYTLLSGDVPFAAADQAALVQRICRGVYSLCGRCWDEVGEDAKDLVSKLIVVDPAARYTSAQCVAHRWIATDECPLASESSFEGCTPRTGRELAGSVSSFLSARPQCSISPRLPVAAPTDVADVGIVFVHVDAAGLAGAEPQGCTADPEASCNPAESFDY
eukprot:m51a1_g4665 putative serine threonine-protein kinase h1 (422) ;mRNA; r:100257-102360